MSSANRDYRVDDFDYDLPAKLIAQQPVEPRDSSRLMVVDRRRSTLSHHTFDELPELLRAGDLLVRNDSRVIPARIIGRRRATGGRWEGLYLRTLEDDTWLLMARTRGRPGPDERIDVADGFALRLLTRDDHGCWRVAPEPHAPAHVLLERFGKLPLPPYIRKGEEGAGDRALYQTTFARVPGSVAAPTAGLHFTLRLCERLTVRGIGIADVTLHIGPGTFRPIQTQRLDEHTMHEESAELSEETARRVRQTRAGGGRVVAVGTTATRTLETAAMHDGDVAPFRGSTDLFIRPGHRFRTIDALVTNFHLPRSSLIVLVSAFAGYELTRFAYSEAVRLGYRFYSYGDAMLIV